MRRAAAPFSGRQSCWLGVGFLARLEQPALRALKERMAAQLRFEEVGEAVSAPRARSVTKYEGLCNSPACDTGR